MADGRLQGGFNMADGRLQCGFNMADGRLQGGFNMADGRLQCGFNMADSRQGSWVIFLGAVAVICRRAAAPLPPPRPVAAAPQSGSVCRFFPECKKMDCAFYHPKPCRFATQCKRAGCTFYHPTTSLPPRHALKWTKAQSS
ncbi:unnamed protein product [Arctogadus glacialis]